MSEQPISAVIGPSHNPVPVVAIVVQRNGTVLCVRKGPNHHWILPGGKPEDGESDLATLTREIGEELCCGVREDIEPLWVITVPDADVPGSTVAIRVWRGMLIGEPRAGAEITELQWVPLSSRAKNLAPGMRTIVLPRLQRLISAVTSP